MSFANGNGASNSQGPDVPVLWRKDWQLQLLLGIRVHQLLFPEGDPIL